MTPRKMRKHRILYGTPKSPRYWLVSVHAAKLEVAFQGTADHVLRSNAGRSLSCRISNGILDNAASFPHNVYFAETIPSRSYVVDKVDKYGNPCHAVAYDHSYNDDTKMNDSANEALKNMARETPELLKKKFLLRVPVLNRKARPSGDSGEHRARTKCTLQGSMARAERAGLITSDVA